MIPMQPAGTTPPASIRYTSHVTGEALSSPRPTTPKHSQPMSTTTIRAAAAHVHTALRAIDWQEVAAIVADGLRILWAAAQILTAALMLAAEIAYEHRQQIRHALVTAAAATYWAGAWTRLQAERTYRAGIWCRLQLLVLTDRAAVLTTAQPVPAVAPITACIQASREALERLVARLYPVLAG